MIKKKNLLAEGQNMLQQKITYLKKYENIKSTELGDKKTIISFSSCKCFCFITFDLWMLSYVNR